MRDTFVKRIRLISFCIIAVIFLLMFRLYMVQIVRGDDYSSRADRQYVRPQEGIFDRGSIYFQDKGGKRVAAATIKNGYALTINPKHITEPSDTYNLLSTSIEIDEEDFLERAGRDDPYEVIAHRLSRKEADVIEEMGLDGVSLYQEQWRYYPGEELAAQAIGFTGYSGDNLSGRYGLERYYDDVLQRDEDATYVNFFAEVFSNVSDVLEDDLTGSGDIVLTIEPTVQSALEKTLEEIMEDWSSQAAGGVVINPKTGAIYALAVSPTFDLNIFGQVDDPSLFGNPIVENVYEMGSIIKSLTMAAGIDAGAVGPRTTYYDAGFLELDGGQETISNYDGRGRGTVDMTQVLGESLNTGVAFVVSKMGNKTFAKYMREYGLAEETGIDLPGEVRGLMDNLNSPRDVEYATASFGQGIALTPIATVRSLSALANGGQLITPHLVQRIEHEAGLSKKIFYDPEGQVIKKSTSDTITQMLVNVVDEYLLGGTVKIEQHSIAAKTGTAQIADRTSGGYYDDRFFHSFFGYFPAYNPEFLIFLFNDRPIGARYASETLTHPFMDLTKFLISYYEIPPDR